MKHYGDITKISGWDLPIVDVITGGSPCQDLSVAGKRAGLDGERSVLFMEQIRIVKEMREHDRATGRTGFDIRPRFMVWENVPGAFSSNKGKDFQCVLTEIVKIVDEGAADVPLPDKGKWSKSGCLYDEMGRWSIAWRLHDAQFWGVPQRRKRIALVADFGGLAAPEVLFERKGLRGDFAESCEEGESPAGDAEGNIGESSGSIGINGDIAGTLDSSYYKGCGERQGIEREVVLCGTSQTEQASDSTGINAKATAWDGTQISPTLTSHNANGSQRMPDKENFNAVISYGLDRASYNQGINAQYDFTVEVEKIATQTAKGPGAVAMFRADMADD